MYQRLVEVLSGKSVTGRILSISHSTKLCQTCFPDQSEIIEANYPECSVLALPFGDGEFDAVVSDQVLEHICGDPQTAIDETYRVLKPGGIALHTTCFINPIHAAPGDYWRFTPDALRLLCQRFSQIIDVGGWGNPYVWLAVGMGLRFEAIPHARWHLLHRLATANHQDWPIVTWVVAQK
jgi:SAM-dependent methyltransferase